ncbi:MAG: hypothetical protein ACN6OD_09770 [Alcaligenes sp.]
MTRYDTFYRSLLDEPLVLHDFIAHCLPAVAAALQLIASFPAD